MKPKVWDIQVICSQKSGVAEICDSRENTAEPVVEELRYVFETITLRTLLFDT